MAHSWIPTTNEIGLQPIADTSTTQNHPLGKVVSAYHATYGGGEFVYLKGIASTVVGDVVTYGLTSGLTTRAPSSGYNLSDPVAVAMSANVASQYGWYQISGDAIVKKPAVKALPSSNVYLSGTTARIRTSAYSGRQVLGAKIQGTTTITTTTSTVVVTLNRPFLQGKVA